MTWRKGLGLIMSVIFILNGFDFAKLTIDHMHDKDGTIFFAGIMSTLTTIHLLFYEWKRTWGI